MIEILEGGNRLVQFDFQGNFYAVLEQVGQMPLPHYIKTQLQDKERYQTVYAREPGSAAAPTAGLHFTPALLDRIRAKGVDIAFVTLHVGLGTFRPVKADDITDHKMHAEHYELSQETADRLNRTRERGGRVIAVGTTSCRTLESVGLTNGRVEPGGGLDQYLHLSRLYVPDSRRADYQFPFAGKYADHAGERLCRVRAHYGGLPSCRTGWISVLQFWGRHADCMKSTG